MAKSSYQFQTIRTEGAILPPDILRRIASLKVDGVTSDAYHLPPGSKLNEAISQSWNVLRQHWQAFQEARAALPEDGETGTAVTNERWLLPLFKELDYGRLLTTKAPVIDERVYPIERFYNHTPIHLIGCKLPLGTRTKGARGAATASPHSMVQEYLNRSEEHLWAFLSNGLQLRILCDNVSLSRQAFVEFDLEAMMEGEVYADFALLWLLSHQSRVESEKAEDCWLENWSKLAREQGTRVLNDLRVGVAKAIEALGRGFIGHPRNDQLREKLYSGTLTKDEFYRQLLRIVYRLLFLFVAEDRELLHPPDSSEEACNLYDTHYSTRRLRELADKIRGSKHADLWHSLSLVFDALSKNEGCPQLGLYGLGSFLWRASSTADLLGPHQVTKDRKDEEDRSESVLITNDDLLLAIRELAYVEQDRVRRTVDYRNLGSEELGSVYESLLELHPVMHVEAKSFELSTAAGNERKTTGSYYTPDSLVQCLLDSALNPVVEDRLKGKKGEAAESAILDLKVCDPACGSGHFLIAAAHRLARHLARVRTGESEPSPEDYQHALRDVIGRCIYGVDLNPMAVELCKVSLWMEAIEPGKPLSFLDHHIQCGNSLLGTTPALLAYGIPDDAFKPIEGDAKAICNDLKRANKKQREEYESGQGHLFAPLFNLGNLPATMSEINVARDESVEDIAAKQEKYNRMLGGADYLDARLLADTWCAAFVWKKDNSDLGELCPTERDFRNIEDNPHNISPYVKAEIMRLCGQYQFFHWHLVFPEVFHLSDEPNVVDKQVKARNGGFDAVLGNPPWERTAFEDKEFFINKSEAVMASPTTALRKKTIEALKERDPSLYASYIEARRMSVGENHLISDSELFPLGASGRVNTYALFTDLALSLTSTAGRTGIIVPTNIATDAPMERFWRFLVESKRLVRIIDFENKKRLFPEVHSEQKFCLLSVQGGPCPDNAPVTVGFWLHSPDEVTSDNRVYSLPLELLGIVSPNTTQPLLAKSKKDLALALKVYTDHDIFFRAGQETPRARAWRALMTAGSSQHFRLKDDLEAEIAADGYIYDDGTSYCPLLESKLIHQFDYDYATYEGVGATEVRKGYPRLTSSSERGPWSRPMPRFWAAEPVVEKMYTDKAWTRPWMVGTRDVTNVNNERTAIACVLPRVGVVQPLNAVSCLSATDALIVVGSVNSFLVDFIARQRFTGRHLNVTTFSQLPIARGEFPEDMYRIGPSVLELTYTSWDLEAFAVDCGYDGPPFRWDEERRFLVRCELDAAFFHIFLGPRAQWDDGSKELRELFPSPRDAVDYIMETFPIVKRKDIARTHHERGGNGRYTTRDTILEIYDKMAESIKTGEPYQTCLDPPPGPPRDSEGNFVPMANWNTTNWPTYVHQCRRESAAVA